jgi:hypothetical protein
VWWYTSIIPALQEEAMGGSRLAVSLNKKKKWLLGKWGGYEDLDRNATCRASIIRKH